MRKTEESTLRTRLEDSILSFMYNFYTLIAMNLQNISS